LFYTKYPNQPASKVQFIPNGYDLKDILSIVNHNHQHKDGKLHIIYSGSLGSKRTPIALFQALKQLTSKIPTEKLLKVDFYGYARQEFFEMNQKMGLSPIVNFHGFVSRISSLKQIISSDVALLIIPEAEGSRTAIPGKLYEYIGAQKFVLALCSPNSAVDRLVRELGLGITTPQHDSGAIKQAIIEILSKHKQGDLSPHLSKHALIQFEHSALTRQLSEIFYNLI